MLTMRTAIGLTQAGLAEILGVSRHAVGGWETGQTYPKPDHLKQLIQLALEQRAFVVGQEAEEIRALWRAARQKVLLDEAWLEGLLSGQPLAPAPAAPPASADPAHASLSASPQRLDWDAALDVPIFYGRDAERALLARWLVEERCRLVSVVGMGGIGKSALVVVVMRQVAPQFDTVIWRSLRNAPSCETLLDSWLQTLSPRSLLSTADALDARLHLLMEQLRSRRVLLVLDDAEMLLEEGSGAGRVRAGFEGYTQLLLQLGASAHQSCLLLTSREKLADLAPLEGSRTLVHSLRLAGLDADAGAQLLAEKDVVSSAEDRARLIEAYSGNPLALRIVAQTIEDVFGGATNLFLAQGDIVFGGVRDLLNQQFDRLSQLEQSVVYWLAILREPVSLDRLLAVFSQQPALAPILEALDGLARRSLIARELRPGSFALHSVVLKYATARLIAEIGGEIAGGRLDCLIAYGLVQAQASEYVRKAQEQLLVAPLLHHAQRAYPAPAALEARLLAFLDQLRATDRIAQGYGPANLVALLRLLRGDLHGLDLSRLTLRGVFLQGVAMQDVDLSEALVRDSVFTDAFDDILGLTINSTGTYWAAVSRRGEVRVWDAGGRTLRHIWHTYTKMLWQHLAFSPDGRTLASGSQGGGGVKIWDVVSGALRWSRWLTKSITWLAFSPDGQILANAGIDAAVRFWDPHDGTPIAELPHPEAVWSLAWSADGHLLASGDVAGTIRLWQVQPGGPARCVQTMAGHDHWVMSLAFSPDGARLASGSLDGAVKLWDLTSSRCLHTFTEHTDRVLRVAWSADGRWLVTAGFDRTIWVRDGALGSALAVLKGHTGVVTGLAFTPHSSMLVSGSDDGTIRVWDMDSRQCLRIISGHVTSLSDIDWSPDGAQVVSGGADTLITLWDVANGSAPRELRGHRWIVQGVAWQPGGQLLASAALDNRIVVWDAVTGELLHELDDPDGSALVFHGLAWSPDGRLLASGSHVRGVQVWDMTTRTRLWSGQTASGLIRRVAWSPDGARLSGGGNDGVVSIWNGRDGRLLLRLERHSGAVMSVAWSPDGRWLASGGAAAGEFFIWNTQSGARVQTLSAHPGVVAGVAWSPAGDLLISGCSDGMLRWWDARSGANLRVRVAHQGAVHALKLSPDGRRLASCGNDGALVIWDVQTGAQLQTLRRDRPYERMVIAGVSGITAAERASLRTLGAVDRQPEPLLTSAAAPADVRPVPRASQRLPRNLPAQPTPFIGRDAELVEIDQILRDPSCHLLTLVGPGGIGKTRLVMQVASTHMAAFADGVGFVALAAVDTPQQMVAAIGDALGLAFAGAADPAAQLIDRLRERHMLLVLDNIEHLLDGVDLISLLLANAPDLIVLVTSRARLNLQAEWLFDVGGLTYPADDSYSSAPTPLDNYSAVQLFVQRIAQIQPRLALDEPMLRAIARICRYVAGMPLAIELAAASTRTMSLVDIERQIHANLDALVTTLRDLPPRHRSMRALFDHSWKLLDGHERILFSRLAVFRGGWTAAAATQVVGATLAELATLIDKSLVRTINADAEDGTPDVAEPRFTMLEPLREYALEQLMASGEAQAIQDAHARYYARLAEQITQQWGSASFDAAITQLKREYDNMRAALAWMRDSGAGLFGLQLANNLWRFWRSRGYFSEGRTWLEQLLASAPSSADLDALTARQRGLRAAAWLASDQHDYAQAVALFGESLQLRRSLSDTDEDTDLLLNAARQARTEGNYQQSTALLEQTLAWHRAQGHDRPQGNGALNAAQQAFGQVLRELAMVLREQGDFVRAEALLQESLAFHQAAADREFVSLALLGLADIGRDQGDAARVRRYGEEALVIVRELSMSWMIGFALNTLALGAFYERDLTRAAMLIRESEATFRDLQADGGLSEILVTVGKIAWAEGNRAAAHQALTEALRKAWAVGPRLYLVAGLEELAQVIVHERAEQSGRLLAAASALRQQMGTPVRPADRAALDATLATVRATLDEDASAALWADAQARSIKQLLSALGIV
jgi:WD40 repeat protein/predicted ATPase/transcriptional regulator with XRE-family HTH domain